MINKLKKLAGAGDILACASTLLLAIVIFRPALSLPPRSEHWHLIYTFNHLEKGFRGIVTVATYFLFGHFRFQPLSHFLLYISYRLTGSAFHLHNLTNLSIYLATITLYYFLLKSLIRNRLFAWLFSLQAAVLYSHSDIITWSYHLHVIFGAFAFFLAASWGALYASTRSIYALIIADLFMLSAMYCYEAFFFFPLILTTALYSYQKEESKIPNQQLIKNTLILYAVYILSFLLYLLIPRFMGDFYWNMRLSKVAPLSYSISYYLFLGNFLQIPYIILTDIFHVNFMVNFFPWIDLPPTYIQQSIYVMNHQYARLYSLIQRYPIMYFFAFLLLLTKVGKSLFNQTDQRREGLAYAGLAGIILTYFLIVVFGRMMTNEPEYILRQFRYQFFPNLMVLALIAHAYLSWTKKGHGFLKKCALAIFLLTSILSNVIYTRKAINQLETLFMNYKVIVTNIAQGIKSGLISPARKLYLDPALVKSNGPWNPDTAHFSGTMQWLFPNSKNYFADVPEKAGSQLQADLSVKLEDPSSPLTR